MARPESHDRHHQRRRDRHQRLEQPRTATGASNYSSRPYAKADRDYDYYRPGYRYGFESANRHRDRDWNAAESDLRTGWDSYEHRGASSKSTWDEVKDAAKDAWDRVRGHGDPHRRDQRLIGRGGACRRAAARR